MAEDTKKDRPRSFSKRGLAPEVRLAVRAVLEKKGEEVRVLDLRAISSFTDYFVIAHGNSSRQNAALADGVEQELKQAGVVPLGIEGRTHGEWILLDYGSLVVHIFSRAARDHYALEKLWGDAPRLEY
jgi:ribosome-associated protein